MHPGSAEQGAENYHSAVEINNSSEKPHKGKLSHDGAQLPAEISGPLSRMQIGYHESVHLCGSGVGRKSHPRRITIILALLGLQNGNFDCRQGLELTVGYAAVPVLTSRPHYFLTYNHWLGAPYF